MAVLTKPLAGIRQRFKLDGFATALAHEQADWAREVAALLEGRYADCERITLVSDNLNTHTKGAFY